jgi:NADH-quinone oxidoreductase subunit N
LAAERPGFALALAVFMWAMAGIPPLSGFFSKLYVFAAAVNGDLTWLAVIGVITSIIGAFYYLRVIKVIYFDAGEPGFDQASFGVRFVITVGALATALFIFLPAPVIAAAGAAAKALAG